MNLYTNGTVLVRAMSIRSVAEIMGDEPALRREDLWADLEDAVGPEAARAILRILRALVRRLKLIPALSDLEEPEPGAWRRKWRSIHPSEYVLLSTAAVFDFPVLVEDLCDGVEQVVADVDTLNNRWLLR